MLPAMSVNKGSCHHQPLQPPDTQDGAECPPSSHQTLQPPHSHMCTPRRLRMRRMHWILAPDSWGAYQRNDFSEPRLLHLPIHRKALNSLTWNIWFSLIKSDLLRFGFCFFFFSWQWQWVEKYWFYPMFAWWIWPPRPSPSPFTLWVNFALESTLFLVPIPLCTLLSPPGILSCFSHLWWKLTCYLKPSLRSPSPSQSLLFPSFFNSFSNIPPFTIYPAILNCMFASLSSWLKWTLWGRNCRLFSSLASDSTRCFGHGRHSGTTGWRTVQMREWAPLSGRVWEPRAATSLMALEAISFSSIQIVKRIDTSGLT